MVTFATPVELEGTTIANSKDAKRTQGIRMARKTLNLIVKTYDLKLQKFNGEMVRFQESPYSEGVRRKSAKAKNHMIEKPEISNPPSVSTKW